MSIQDLFLTSLSNLQTDGGDLRGSLNQILNNMNGAWVPAIDIFDSKDMLIVYVELPGYHIDIKVDFSSNKLTISGSKYNNNNNLNISIDTVIKNEIAYGKYSRTILLPIHISNKKNVTTEYKNGLLCIKINKNNEEPNQFVIKIGDS